jgi:hypothetical protein
MARPSKATPALKDAILERLTESESLRQICSDEAMPNRSTIARWLEEDEDFATKYARVREMQADFMDALVLDTADKCTVETAAADRVKIAAYQWRAAKLKPKVYSDKLDLTSGGEKIGLPAEIEASRRRAASGNEA